MGFGYESTHPLPRTVLTPSKYDVLTVEATKFELFWPTPFRS